MNKSLLYATFVLSIGTVSCAGNATLPPSASLPESYGASKTRATENVPPGWASTATRAVPIKNFAIGTVADKTALHIVVGLFMHDREGARQLVRSQYTPGHVSF